MEKIKRQSIKTACSLLLSLLLVLTGTPLEGVGRVFADPVPKATIKSVILERVNEKKGESAKDKLTIDYNFDNTTVTGPRVITVWFNGTKPVTIKKENQTEGTTISVDITDELIFGNDNAIKLSFEDNSATHETEKFYIGLLPELDSFADSVKYSGKKLTLKGRNFIDKQESSQNPSGGDQPHANYDHLIIANQKQQGNITIPLVSPPPSPPSSKYSDIEITVDPLQATPKGKPRTNKIEFWKTYAGTTDKVKSEVRVIYNDYITVVDPIEGIDSFEVLPDRGPSTGGSYVRVYAYEKQQRALDKFQEGDKIIFQNEKYRTKEIEIKAESYVRNSDGKVEAVKVKVPAYPGTSGNGGDISSYGVFDVVLKRGEALVKAEKAFTYLSAKDNLKIDRAEPETAEDKVSKPIGIIGENILSLDKTLFQIPEGAKLTLTGKAESDHLHVNYNQSPVITGKKLKFGKDVVTGVERKVYVTIGVPLSPAVSEIKNDAADTEKKYHSYGNRDTVIFNSPRFTAGDKKDYPVQVRTLTTITLEGGKTVELEEDDFWESFHFESTVVDPIIKKVEPAYGYPFDSRYYDISGLEGYFNSKDPSGKKLRVRISGEKFRVKELPGTAKKELPKVSVFYKAEDSPVAPDLRVESLKVLKEQNGELVEVTGRDQDIYGDVLLVEIDFPSDSSSSRDVFRDILKQWKTGTTDRYYEFNSPFRISNPGGGQSKYDPNIHFKFRFTTDSYAPQSIQPVIKSVNKDGQPVSSLNPSTDNSVEVVMHTGNSIGLENLIFTLDGKLAPSSLKGRKGNDDLFTVNLPKGVIGKAKLQAITQHGLIDSWDINFTTVPVPIIESLTPKEGPAGTFVIIKRAGGAKFIQPSNSDKIGTKVLFNGKNIDSYNGSESSPTLKESEWFTDPLTGKKAKIPGKYVYVADADTIIIKIPENIASIADIKDIETQVQVENQGNLKSPPVTFSLINTGGGKIKIQSIEPNKGDANKGEIPVTIRGEGFGPEGVDVYFGSEPAVVGGYNEDFTEVYVFAPPLKGRTLEKNQSYYAPVTVVNKTFKNSDTLFPGFMYKNPDYIMTINNVRKEGSDPKDPDRSKGTAGDIVWIEGVEFRQPVGGDESTLPEVYFGHRRVPKEDILEYKEVLVTEKVRKFSGIKVKAPKLSNKTGKDETVRILVVNYDGVTAITKQGEGFTYITSKPQIMKVIPDKASRYYDRDILVEAKGVNESGLQVFFGDSKDPEKNRLYKEEVGSVNQVKVWTEKEEGERFVVTYDPKTKKAKIQYFETRDGTLVDMADLKEIKGNKEVDLKDSTVDIKKDTDTIVKINWSNPAYHKRDGLNRNPELVSKLHPEYVSIRLQDKENSSVNELVVRRFLGKVVGFTMDSIKGIATIKVKTPFYDTKGPTEITLFNLDGSSISAPFTFHEGLGDMEITDFIGSIERTVKLNGKEIKARVVEQDVRKPGILIVKGKGFKDIERILVGDMEIKPDTVKINSEYTELTILIPQGKEELVGKPQTVTIISKNGSVSSDQVVGLPLYFRYILPDSEPIIESLTPAEGPRTGGTFVKIEGKGFKETDNAGVKGPIKVTFDGKEAVLRSMNRNPKGEITEIHVTAPAAQTGKAKVQVKNADGALSPEKEFTYISQPVITKAGDAVFFNDAETEVTLTVEDLQEGAEVIIGGEMKKGLAKGEKKPQNVTAEGMLGVRNGENLTAYVIGGQKAKDVKVSKEKGTLSFKLPAGIEELEKMSVIIRNPDSGISEPKDNIIKPPIPDTPIIYADPGAEGSVVLSWKVDLQALNAAEKFEVYAKLSSDSEYTFVGDTKQNTPEQAYIVKGLEHGTSYDFKVRVLNKYGEAKDLGYVRGFTLSASSDYKQQEKQEAADRAIEKIQTEGKQEIVGTTLRYTVGTAQTAVDFTKNGKYKEKQLQIPVRDILTNRGKVLFVTDGKINLQLSYAALSVPELSKASEDAFLRVSFSQPDKKKEDALRSAIGRKSTRLSPIYKLDFELVEPKKTLKIKQLAGTISIGFPAGEAGYPAEYIGSSDRFERLSGTAISKGGYYVLLKDKNK